MKNSNLSFKLKVIALILATAIACAWILIPREPEITETPEGIPYTQERTVEENAKLETKENSIGDFTYEVPADFETSNFSFDASQKYSNGTDMLNIYFNAEDSLQSYKDMYEGEDKTIGPFNGFYYIYQIEGTEYHVFLFEYHNTLYTIESTSYEVLENFVNSLAVIK
jgi:hypothetical protein